MRIRLRWKIVMLAAGAALLPALSTVAVIVHEQDAVGQRVGGELDELGRANLASIARDVRALCATADGLTDDDAQARAAARRAILDIAVGETGYAFAIGGQGTHRGHYVVSKDGARDGENIWEARDADGRPVIQAIVTKGLRLAGDGVAFERYPWRNQGEASSRYKITAITYYEPWDWVIGAGTYEEEFTAPQRTILAALDGLVLRSVLGSLVLLALTVACAIIMGGRIAAPVMRMAEVARSVARGDLSQEIQVRQSDEVGQLADAFRDMQTSLRGKADAAAVIARGDLTVQVEAASEEDVLGASMVEMVDTLQAMNREVQALVRAAVAGDLSARGDVERFSGDFAAIVAGVNETLSAILGPIEEASQVLERLAARDLTARVEGDYRGDHRRIKDALNRATDSLDASLRLVGTASEQVSAAAAQISGGSQSLAEGASEQASSLEEISSSLEEMSSMTRQNSDAAEQARSLAASARDEADTGVQAAGRMGDAIDRIKASSDETAKILGAIDEIAFQTNLLALNAAVEAARAGDAGKGFAVVAEEVRSLAQRCTEAAKQTADLIEQSLRNAAEGVTVTQETNGSLSRISEGSRSVSGVVEGIAGASKEQASGIEQVNTAVTQLDKVTQQNAANAEESASAAEELSGQAAELSRLVGQFTLSPEGSGTATPARRSAAAAPPDPEPTPEPAPALTPGRTRSPAEAVPA